MIFRFLILFIVLTSCVADYQYKNIEPYYVLHDNSSKVWIINHLYKNGMDEVPLSFQYKKMIVFHSSRNCYIYQIDQLGEKAGNKGEFSIQSEKKEMEIQFKNEKWKFTILNFDENLVKMKSIDTKDGNYTMELIPFPEI